MLQTEYQEIIQECDVEAAASMAADEGLAIAPAPGGRGAAAEHEAWLEGARAVLRRHFYGKATRHAQAMSRAAQHGDCDDNDGLGLHELQMRSPQNTARLRSPKNSYYPEHVVQSQREMYLGEAAFVQTLRCTRDEFALLPKWKQIEAKRAARLF